MTQKTTISTFQGYALRKDVEMWTGYRGRGMQPLMKVFPAGTRVLLTITKYKGEYIAHDGEVPTHVKYTVTKNDSGELYGATHTIPWEAEDVQL